MSNGFFILRKVCVVLFVTGCFILPASAAGPDGYTYCADENGSFTLPGTCHVAYGANGSFVYRYNMTGLVTFSNANFSDPAPHYVKKGYYKIATNTEPADELVVPLEKIRDHLNESSLLSESEIIAQDAIIKEKIYLLNNDVSVVQTAIEIVNLYETNRGPLFLNNQTSGSINTTPATDGKSIDRAVLTIQQGVFDLFINQANIETYPTLINGLAYQTADWFPGHADAPVDPSQTHSVTINASVPTDWGRERMFSQEPARRATGCYLAPGSIATVTVPSALVNAGYRILVGAHSWDKSAINPQKRFSRVTKSYSISSETTQVANPFGGGIYIIVPYEADAGLANLSISNVIRSPFFSQKPWHQTTDAEWQNTERNHPAPWADFESEKFMMQVPTSWITNFDTAGDIMDQWDIAMDGVLEILGYPSIRNNVVLYIQPDTSIMGTAYFPGYPQANTTYTPNRSYSMTASDLWMLNDPMERYVEFHELGHAERYSMFYGESEAVVHLLYTYVKNVKFGADLDTAFSSSCSGEQGVWTLESTAKYWMARENFRAGLDMADLSYEHTGHAKYAEIANLFGWDAIKNFYYDENLKHENNDPGDDLSDTDSRIYRLSKFAGVDLTPLIHYWGRKPDDPNALKAKLSLINIYPSTEIYYRLMEYKNMIPKNNAEFLLFIDEFYPDGTWWFISEDAEFGYWWLQSMASTYDEAYAQTSQQAVQNIIETYFDPSSIEPEEGFSSTAWVDDSDLPFSTEKTYTHAIDFANADGSFEVNGVTVTQKGVTGAPMTGTDSVSGLGYTISTPLEWWTDHGNNGQAVGTSGLTGSASTKLATGMIAYWGSAFPFTIELQGLQKNTDYTFTFFSPLWDAGDLDGRIGVLDGGTVGAGNTFTIQQDPDFITSAQIVKYAYNTGNSTTFTMSLSAGGATAGAPHFYSFANSYVINDVPEIGEVDFELLSGSSEMAFSWYGEDGQTYGLETTDNLVTGIWQTVTNVSGSDEIISLTDDMDQTNAFYRVYMGE